MFLGEYHGDEQEIESEYNKMRDDDFLSRENELIIHEEEE